MKLLVFDTAYTFDLIKKRGIEEVITSRNLNGFFTKVINANFSSGLLNLRDKNKKIETKIKLNKNCYIIQSNFLFLSQFIFFWPLCLIIGILKFISQIYFTCKKEKFDFVRSEDPLINGLLGYFFSKIFNLPLIICVWGNPDLIRKNSKKPIMRYLMHSRLEKAIEKFTLSKAHKILITCKDDEDFVLKLGINKKKIFFYSISTSIPKVHFELPKRKYAVFQKNSKTFYKLVTVARLEKEKNVLDLIFMMKEIKQSCNYVNLYLIGDGSLRNEILKKIKIFGLKKHVFLLGDKSQIFIAKTLRSADLIISPLTGRALLESLLSGTPILAYDVNFHKDYITNGHNGFLIEDRNYKKLSEKVLFMKKNTVLSKTIGRNGRDLALKKFNFNYIINQQIKMYLNLYSIQN